MGRFGAWDLERASWAIRMSEESTGANPVKRTLSAVGSAVVSTLRATSMKIDAVSRSTATARAVSDMENRLQTFRRERKLGKGTLRATYVVPYRGFVVNEIASVRVRVMEEPVIPDSAQLVTDPKVLRTNLRRFIALSFPGVSINLSMGGVAAQSVSDRYGYATSQIAVPGLNPGWHDYICETEPDDRSEEPTRAVGQVLLPDPLAEFAVISDVDDTVLKTGLSEGFISVGRTLMSNAKTRKAIPGMSVLYEGLHHGFGEKGKPAFYYLSTGPWNLYDMLTEFLELRGFPKGVLFLTDWGPQERYVMRSGQEHKRLALRKLFESYPETSYILIGDSGQKDPINYVEAARAHPDQVKAIFILDVGEHMAQRAAELRDEAKQLAKEGISFHFVADAREAAQICADLKLVDPQVVHDVKVAFDYDLKH